MPQLDIDALRRTVAQNRCVITAHAKQRMGHRRVTDHDVQRVVDSSAGVSPPIDSLRTASALLGSKLQGLVGDDYLAVVASIERNDARTPMGVPPRMTRCVRKHRIAWRATRAALLSGMFPSPPCRETRYSKHWCNRVPAGYNRLTR